MSTLEMNVIAFLSSVGFMVIVCFIWDIIGVGWETRNLRKKIKKIQEAKNKINE